MTKTFLLDLMERAVRAFAAALLGALGTGQTVANVNWLTALAIGGMAAVVSVLLSLASLGTSGSQTASLLPPPAAPGRHEAQ